LPTFGIGRRDAVAERVMLALTDHHGMKGFCILISNVELEIGLLEDGCRDEESEETERGSGARGSVRPEPRKDFMT